MLRKSITAAVITAFEILLTLDQWDGISKIITAAVVFWGMNMFHVRQCGGADCYSKKINYEGLEGIFSFEECEEGEKVSIG